MKPPKAAKCDNLEWSADPFSDVTQSFLYKFIHCCLTISAASCYSNGSDRLHCFHNTKWSITFANMHPHLMHGSSSLPPKRHLISVQPFLQFIFLPNAENHMLYYAFHWTAHPLKNTTSHVGRSTPPSNTWFLGLTWFCLPNWLTYGSVIFAGLIGVTNEQATLLRLQQQAAFMLCVTQPNNTSLLCNMYNRRPSHHHNIHNSIKL